MYIFNSIWKTAKDLSHPCPYIICLFRKYTFQFFRHKVTATNYLSVRSIQKKNWFLWLRTTVIQEQVFNLSIKTLQFSFGRHFPWDWTLNAAADFFVASVCTFAERQSFPGTLVTCLNIMFIKDYKG